MLRTVTNTLSNYSLFRWKALISAAVDFYPGPRSFSWAARESRSGEKRKTSGYLGLETQFHANASCQTRQKDNYKKDQWQLSDHPSRRYYQSNKAIILICVVVTISTNPSLRVTFWPCRLPESEIQFQCNKRFFSSRLSKKNLWDQANWRSSILANSDCVWRHN